MTDQGNLKAMMAQLQGALNKGPGKPRKKVTAEPQVEVSPQRGVGPTPGNVKGIDDVDTREATQSQIAGLARESERTDQQQLAQDSEDPELAELLGSVDSGSAELPTSPAIVALVQEPPDTSEDATQQSRVSHPEEPEPVLTGEDVESVPPSLAPAPQEDKRTAQRRVLEQMGSQIKADLLKEIDSRIEPIRQRVDEIKASVERTTADVYEKMGELAEGNLAMDTFVAFFEDEFAPLLKSVQELESVKTQAQGLDAKSATELQSIGSRLSNVENKVESLDQEMHSDGGLLDNLSKEVDNFREQLKQLNDSTVSTVAWDELLENTVKPLLEMLEQWEDLTGPGGERVKGMVHAHKEASVVVAIEILRKITEQNFHKLQDFVNEYGRTWVKELMGYLAENPEVVQDKVALAKFNVIYDHMAKSPKLQSYKSEVDVEVKKVLSFATQLSGDS